MMQWYRHKAIVWCTRINVEYVLFMDLVGNWFVSLSISGQKSIILRLYYFRRCYIHEEIHTVYSLHHQDFLSPCLITLLHLPMCTLVHQQMDQCRNPWAVPPIPKHCLWLHHVLAILTESLVIVSRIARDLAQSSTTKIAFTPMAWAVDFDV